MSAIIAAIMSTIKLMIITAIDLAIYLIINSNDIVAKRDAIESTIITAIKSTIIATIRS